MNQLGDRTSTAVPETLERELRLVREAIALVAAGYSARVVVANLRFGEALIVPARQIADGKNVRVLPLWSMGDARIGIAVEAAGNG
jgi:hypothetical protein